MPPIAPEQMMGPMTTADSAASGRLKVDVGGQKRKQKMKKKKKEFLQDVVRDLKKKENYAYSY